MKKFINGAYIEVTAEDLDKLPKSDESETTKSEPTLQERLEALESLLLEKILEGSL